MANLMTSRVSWEASHCCQRQWTKYPPHWHYVPRQEFWSRHRIWSSGFCKSKCS